eukprot:1442471-Amphidinium_carterae.1
MQEIQYQQQRLNSPKTEEDTERKNWIMISGEGAVNRTSQPVAGLTFMHVPFNFGHTVEGVASYGQGIVWGSMYPALQATSDVTGCP